MRLTNFIFTICRYWLSVGAQASEPVQRILFRAGLLPPPPMMAMGRKGGPRDTRPVDPMTGRVLTPEKQASADQPKASEGGGGFPGYQESIYLLGYPPEKQFGLA
ncbi:small ribosomal subunit protein bS16m/bS16c-like [Corylus avellana]|uniref:small ribosomal subunit protein bS16m/bS16c-like n=1 Tax=Corylus avellana TaxID=13451 RepID=UPI00286D2F4D|nr:small ribosomal subunit protein bS16m/bS16c-like [Corylus avellana]